MEDPAAPEFLQMKGEGPITSGRPEGFTGWPAVPAPQPVAVTDDEGRITRVRTPVHELDGLITPNRLFYAVQHFGVPDAVDRDAWELSIEGSASHPVRLTYAQLRSLPGHTVRTVMECSGSDAKFFDYVEGKGERPSRAREGMILSAGEFSGVSLSTILELAGLKDGAAWVMAEGWDTGVPSNAPPGQAPFNYAKALPLEKAQHPDTILAWAMNGEPLDHLHGAPVRLIVPGWAGNWSVKWLRRLEIRELEPDLWYHYRFYYYGKSPDDPERELITSLGVKSIVCDPADDGPLIPVGPYLIRGLAWSGESPISLVELSFDEGQTWQEATIEEPRERWMWARWWYKWHADRPGRYRILSRAKDAVGRVQRAEPRHNVMQKNFDAMVPCEVTVE